MKTSKSFNGTPERSPHKGLIIDRREGKPYKITFDTDEGPKGAPYRVHYSAAIGGDNRAFFNKQYMPDKTLHPISEHSEGWLIKEIEALLTPEQREETSELLGNLKTRLKPEFSLDNQHS